MSATKRIVIFALGLGSLIAISISANAQPDHSLADAYKFLQQVLSKNDRSCPEVVSAQATPTDGYESYFIVNCTNATYALGLKDGYWYTARAGLPQAVGNRDYPTRYAAELASHFLPGGPCDQLKNMISRIASQSTPANVRVLQIDKIVDAAYRSHCVVQ